MRDLDSNSLTQAVVESFAATPDARLKLVLTSLVTHLHAFARDVRLTEDEWRRGIEFLTRVGHITDGERQEFILLSDTLGLSMLTVAMNHGRPPGCTQATVLGPFFVDGAPDHALGADVGNGAAGVPCTFRGAVRGDDGAPLAGARIHVWQADAEGTYDVQRPDLPAHQARGSLRADADGRFHFRSVLAEPYPIPHDGPVGEMLRATARHPWRPAHMHFIVEAPGHERLVTHVFRDGDPYLDSDAVFAVRRSLVVPWLEQPDGSYLVEFDFVLPRVAAGPRGD